MLLFITKQLALVETTFRVNLGLVVGERLQFGIGQEFKLGDANAVLARNHAVQAARQRHDAFDGAVGRLQHLIVVAVDGNVGVHIAVTGVHVQGHPDAPLQHSLVKGVAFFQHRLERHPAENLLQWLADLGLPAGAQGMVLQLGKQRFDIAQPARPQAAHPVDEGQRLRHPVLQQFGGRNPGGIVMPTQRQRALAEKLGQRLTQGQFIAQTQLDVDALNAICVLGHARQRNHHVFIDLEGIGVFADGRRALAVKPEFLARLGADGNKTFPTARIGNAHHLRRDASHLIGIVTGNVTKQHHLGHTAAAQRHATFALGGVTHRLQVAVIQVFQPSQQHA